MVKINDGKGNLRLCGMTGTAFEVAPELKRVYDLEVCQIPTLHLPGARKHLASRCWNTADERWQAVVRRAIGLSLGRAAVLIGTRSVEASEHLSEQFHEQGIAHAVLNARNDLEEAELVALAGQSGRITIATNMTGRGTDIKPAEEVLKEGGLHVILTEFHESARIDRQLFGRTARQGQPGSVEAMVSLEDELFGRHAPLLLGFVKRAAAKRGTLPQWLLYLLVNFAQLAADRHNRAIRMRRLANPDARLEAITSRPWLMSSVGQKTEHSGQTTITLTGLHADSRKARAALTRVSALLQEWFDLATEQLKPTTVWVQVCDHLKRILACISPPKNLKLITNFALGSG